MMQAELPFRAHQLARTGNPDTSHDAAAGVRKFRHEHHATIIGVLEAVYPCDANADEIAQRCALDRHQIGRRLGELERDGLIQKSGEKRPSGSGRPACCYRVMP